MSALECYYELVSSQLQRREVDTVSYLRPMGIWSIGRHYEDVDILRITHRKGSFNTACVCVRLTVNWSDVFSNT